MDILWRPIGRHPRLEPWEARPLWPGVERPPTADARVDAYEREAPREAPGAPEPAGPHRRVAAAILRFLLGGSITDCPACAGCRAMGGASQESMRSAGR